MVIGLIGCVGFYVLVFVEVEWKYVYVCVWIWCYCRVEKIVWEVYMKCSSVLRLYVLVSIICIFFKYYFFLIFWFLVIFYKNKIWLKLLCIMKLMEIGVIGYYGFNVWCYVGVEMRLDYVIVVIWCLFMEENFVLEI